MIRCTTYANLSKVGGTSYIPVLGDGKLLGGYARGICPVSIPLTPT